jgi:hypothetical protein
MLKILSILIYALVRGLHFTYRYRYVGNEKLLTLKQNNKNFIFAIWHQNLFSGILAQTGLPYIVIVSKSKDAEAVAFTCQRLGHLVVRGSSKKGNVDKGGSLALGGMIDFLKQGFPGAVTVDGPKGPAFKVKPGIIGMARHSGAQIIPYATRSNRHFTFNSWDQFQLPKPFAKIVVAYGDPLKVDPDCDDYEGKQLALESEMNKLTIEAESELVRWNELGSKNWFFYLKKKPYIP